MTVMMVDAVLMSAIKTLGIDLPEWLTQFRQSALRPHVRNRPFAEMKRSKERSVDVLDGLALSDTVITDTGGMRIMTTELLPLGDGITYLSNIPPEEAATVDEWFFPATDGASAHIRMKRGRLPETVLAGLIGKHISRVVGHPFLTHPDMIIDRVDHGTDGGTPTIEIGLMQVLLPMEAPA